MHKAKSAYTGLHAYSNGFTQTCHFKKIKQFKKRKKDVHIEVLHPPHSKTENKLKLFVTT